MSDIYNGIDLDQLNDQLDGKAVCIFIDNYLKPMDSCHFVCCLDTLSNRFVKVMNKDLIWRRSGFDNITSKPISEETEEEESRELVRDWSPSTEIIKHKLDTANYGPDIVRLNSDIFPEIVFETDTYIATEWLLEDWRPCQTEDLIVRSVLRVPVATKLFRIIASKIVSIQKNSRIHIESQQEKDQIIDEIYSQYKNYYANMSVGDLYTKEQRYSSEWYLTTAFASLHIQDILINKNDPMQWKYVDIENLYTGESINRCFWVDGTCAQGSVDDLGYHIPLPNGVPDEYYSTDSDIIKYFHSGSWRQFII